jgi:hypothetical protein
VKYTCFARAAESEILRRFKNITTNFHSEHTDGSIFQIGHIIEHNGKLEMLVKFLVRSRKLPSGIPTWSVAPGLSSATASFALHQFTSPQMVRTRGLEKK